MNKFWQKRPTALDGERILIADDDAPIRKLFSMILELEFPDIRIDLASNGIEAVRLFDTHRHSLIIMDLRMPEMDGLQAFYSIEQLCGENRSLIPAVLFCAGCYPPDGVENIVGEGLYHGFVRKPVNSKDLIQAVAERRPVMAV